MRWSTQGWAHLLALKKHWLVRSFCLCLSVSWLLLVTVEWTLYQTFCPRWALVSDVCVCVCDVSPSEVHVCPIPVAMACGDQQCSLCFTHTLPANDRGTSNDLHQERKSVCLTVCVRRSPPVIYIKYGTLCDQTQHIALYVCVCVCVCVCACMCMRVLI